MPIIWLVSESHTRLTGNFEYVSIKQFVFIKKYVETRANWYR